MQARADDSRGTSTERGYDSVWRKLRLSFLRRHPFCECDECKAGIPQRAEVVDHIQTIRDRPDLRLVESNLRAMSKSHHDRHTAQTVGWGK